MEATIPLPTADVPIALESTPDGRLLLVAMRHQGEIVFIDTASHRILFTLTLSGVHSPREIRFRRR